MSTLLGYKPPKSPIKSHEIQWNPRRITSNPPKTHIKTPEPSQKKSHSPAGKLRVCHWRWPQKYTWFSHSTWWCSSPQTVNVYQRVSSWKPLLKLWTKVDNVGYSSGPVSPQMWLLTLDTRPLLQGACPAAVFFLFAFRWPNLGMRIREHHMNIYEHLLNIHEHPWKIHEPWIAGNTHTDWYQGVRLRWRSMPKKKKQFVWMMVFILEMTILYNFVVFTWDSGGFKWIVHDRTRN